MTLRIVLLAIALTLPAPGAGASAAPPPAAGAEATLDEVFSEYFEGMLALHPEFASQIGDHRYDDRLTLDITEEHRRRMRSLAETSAAALRKIDPEVLSERQRVHREALAWQLARIVEGLEFPEQLLPLAPGFGKPGSFAHLGSGNGDHPFRETSDYENFLSRISDFELWVETAIHNMEEGVRRKTTHPRIVVERVLSEISPLTRAAGVEETVFSDPLENFPAGMPPAEREKLRGEFTIAVSDRLLPAYRRLERYLEEEYLPNCRITLGLHYLPRGREWYAQRVRFFTSTELKPAAIFALGQREVERISREMDRLAADAGVGVGREAYLRQLQRDPANSSIGERRILADYRAIQERVSERLPTLFSRLPSTKMEIRTVEPHRRAAAPGAFYERPSFDGRQPGIFYFNPRGGTASRITMEALFLHEGLPGHHLQIALAAENEELPEFLRFGYSGAFVEGWALYAEALGADLGLYRDSSTAFGRLIFELGRAGRLLGDVGIHHKGWSQAEAVDRLGRRGLGWAISELPRYAVLPGQALSYKIGEQELLRLRRRAEAALGARFDLRDFHRLVLEDGPLPMTVLESKLERRLEAEKGDRASLD